MNISLFLTLILIAPLVSAGIIALLLRRHGSVAAAVSVVTALWIAAGSLYFLLNWDGEQFGSAMEWMKLGSLEINMGYFINHPAAVMLLVVSFVAFWIHVFSIGYMNDDDSKARYFGGLSIFMFAILGIVFADNLLMIFVFWELVGFSSYMLIAHYWKTDFASWASRKAFIVNRVGDFGFLIGIVWTYWHFGTVNLQELAQLVAIDPTLISTGIGLLLMCGFLGKSAQFPLHVWLPDAMAGPTPVSALIHAATMVAAGVYFMARVFFMLSPEVLDVVLWLAVIMTAYAGICALGQRDIKKILAFSTLSQLGYMGAAIGLGFPGLALFHLATHACFKACLFLGAGSVIHACHHEQDIFKMGGLARRMPLTTLSFAIASMALCAVTFTSGYYSKDAIIEAALVEGRTGFFVVLLLSALLTALYMGRLFFVAFLGKPNSEHAEHARESGIAMVLPLMVLGLLSLAAGWYTLWPPQWAAAFAPEVAHVHEAIAARGLTTIMLIAGICAWLGGLVIAFLVYGAGSPKDQVESRVPGLYAFFESKLYFDEVYNWYVSRVQQRVADLIGLLDLILISGLLVRGSAAVVGLFGLMGRALHTGNVHNYVYWFLGGVILFWLFAAGIL